VDSRAWQTGLRIGKVAVPILTAAVVAAISLAGVIHIPLGWIALLVVTLALVEYAAVEALRTSDQTRQIYLLWCALGAAISIPIGLWSYHQWGDPQIRARPVYAMVVNGGGAKVWYQSDLPGEPYRLSLGSIAGGWIIQVDCFGVARDGTHWYRVSGPGNGFLPTDAVRPAYGVDGSKIPAC
jgi:hypothetical protein